MRRLILNRKGKRQTRRQEHLSLGEVSQAEANNRKESRATRSGMDSRLQWMWVVVISVLFMTTSAWSQSDRGTLTGVVSDSSGGVLPGVALQATNLADGQQYFGKTTPTGLYSIASLPAGVYELKVGVPGFKRSYNEGSRSRSPRLPALTSSLKLGRPA
jgi:hypothetical protein